MSKEGINIILYPRTYNKRGGESLHSVQGITESGKAINVKLRVDDKHLSSEHAPSVAEFSRTDYGAQHACLADLENGPENRHGVLLFSQCALEKIEHGIEIYVAKWASILSSGPLSPEPLIGLGRIAVKKIDAVEKRLERELRMAKEEGDIERISMIESKFNDPRTWSHPVIMYYPERMYSGPSSDVESFKNAANHALNDLSSNGMTGGLMIRLVNEQGRIVNKSYFETFSRYIPIEERYQTPSELVSSIITSIIPKRDIDYFDSKSMRIEFVPIKRINSAKKGNAFYGESSRFSHTKRMFYHDAHQDEDVFEAEPMLCKVAVRVSYYPDSDVSLLSRIHTLSMSPYGHPQRIDRNGRFTYLLDNENAKLSQIPVKEEDLIERTIGITIENLPHRAIWMIKGESAPIVPALRSNEHQEYHLKIGAISATTTSSDEQGLDSNLIEEDSSCHKSLDLPEQNKHDFLKKEAKEDDGDEESSITESPASKAPSNLKELTSNESEVLDIPLVVNESSVPQEKIEVSNEYNSNNSNEWILSANPDSDPLFEVETFDVEDGENIKHGGSQNESELSINLSALDNDETVSIDNADPLDNKASEELGSENINGAALTQAASKTSYHRTEMQTTVSKETNKTEELIITNHEVEENLSSQVKVDCEIDLEMEEKSTDEKEITDSYPYDEITSENEDTMIETTEMGVIESQPDEKSTNQESIEHKNEELVIPKTDKPKKFTGLAAFIKNRN